MGTALISPAWPREPSRDEDAGPSSRCRPTHWINLAVEASSHKHAQGALAQLGEWGGQKEKLGLTEERSETCLPQAA